MSKPQKLSASGDGVPPLTSGELQDLGIVFLGKCYMKTEGSIYDRFTREMGMDIAAYFKPLSLTKGREGGNAAQFLLSTTLTLGVFFVYLVPAADSHSFVFQVVPPFHCVHTDHYTLYNLSPFTTHTGMSVGEAKLYGDRS